VRTQPVLVYDGDCAFCTRCVDLIDRRYPTAARVVAWQHADLADLGLSQERVEYELVWVEPDGESLGGAQAVGRLLREVGPPWSPLGALVALPVVRGVAHGLYRLVANNRHRMPGGTPACALPAAQRPGAR